MPVLTAIDILGIQSYIFASNRLRDVVGASYLVEWATSRDGGLRLEIENVPTPKVVVAAGGNAILWFDSIDAAKQFVLQYSRRLLDKAPGLDVTIAHQFYDHGKLARGLLALQVELAKAKLHRRPHVPQLGLSVMQPCAVTGLPASSNARQANNEWVSSRIAKIREAKTVEIAASRWEPFLPPDVCGRKACFPDVLDEMGRTRGDTSLIGVVHVDGNGIGKRIQRWLVSKLDDQSITDDGVIDEYRKWSEALTKLGEDVLQAVITRLVNRIEHDQENGGFFVCGQPSSPRQLDFELGTDRDRAIRLPLRPILLGGDDLTFVCDGRIALDLATTALRAFVEQSSSVPALTFLSGVPVTACAGVAIVKAHAPFNRSYQLSEDLCNSAKQAKRDAEPDTNCWIDWHIGTIRPDESVADIRKRQYEGDQGRKLTCRPYPIDGDSSRRLTWEWLDGELLGEPAKDGRNRLSFRNPEVWGERRNKVKALANVLADGDTAVQNQLQAWNSVDPGLGLPSPIDVNGFKGSHTPLLDAVELLDVHLRLEASESSPQVGSETAEVKT